MAGEPIEKPKLKGPPQWLLDRKKTALADCRLLYSGIKKPATESLMCFGWECGDGWNDILANLPYKLESLNIRFYKKYRVRIEAEQVKEKYGTLRFYYQLYIDPPEWRWWLEKTT